MVKMKDVPSIGEYTAILLAKHGIKTVKALAETSLIELETIPGFSSIRAARVNQAACALIASASGSKTVGSTDRLIRTDNGKKPKKKKKVTQKRKDGKKAKGKQDKKDKEKIKEKKQKAQSKKDKKSKKSKKANKK